MLFEHDRIRRVSPLGMVGLWVVLLLSASSSTAEEQRPWTSRGPEDAATRSLAVDPTNDQVWLAGTSSANIFGSPFSVVSGAQIYRSTDGGVTWKSVLTGLDVVSALVFEPNSSTVWAATRFSGLLRSYDAGLTWETVFADRPVYSVALSPLDPDFLVIGLDVAPVRSFDGGESWVIFNGLWSYNNIYTQIVMDPNDADRLLLGDGDWVSISEDRGATWRVLTRPGPQPNGYRIFAIELDPANPNTFWAGTNSGEVYRSDDAGESWTLLEVDESVRFFWSMEFDAERRHLYAVGNNDLFRSPDGGESWTRLSNDDFPWAYNLVFTDTGFLGNEWGVVEYREGEGWTRYLKGFRSARITDIAAAPEFPRLMFASSTSGIYRSRDAGLSWELLLEGIPLNHVVFRPPVAPGAPPEVLTASNGRILHSLDGGDTWDTLTWDWFADYRDIVVRADNPDILYGVNVFQVVRSVDGGATWTRIGVGTLPIRDSTGLVVDRFQPDVLYISRAGFAENLWRSTDGGETFQALVTGDTAFLGLYALTQTPGGTLLAAAEDGIYRFDFDTSGWVRQVESTRIITFALDPFDPDHLVAGGDLGELLQSFDGGFSWQAVDAGLPGAPIRSAVITHSKQRRITVGLYGGSIFQSPSGGPRGASAGSTSGLSAPR